MQGFSIAAPLHACTRPQKHPLILTHNQVCTRTPTRIDTRRQMHTCVRMCTPTRVRTHPRWCSLPHSRPHSHTCAHLQPPARTLTHAHAHPRTGVSARPPPRPESPPAPRTAAGAAPRTAPAAPRAPRPRRGTIGELVVVLGKHGNASGSERVAKSGWKYCHSQQNARAKIPAQSLLIQREYFWNHLA